MTYKSGRERDFEANVGKPSKKRESDSRGETFDQWTVSHVTEAFFDNTYIYTQPFCFIFLRKFY